MAIWDKKENKTKLSADSRKCLACGDNLKFFVDEGYLQCNSCGSVFYPDVFEINAMLEDRYEHEIDFSQSELDEVTKFSMEKRHEIICNSCGSVVVANKNTISTFCAFCGSPAIVGRRIQKEFKPDLIIPFKVNREEAQAKVREWVCSSSNASRLFKSKAVFSKMTGLYVPFWLVDADCEMNVSGQCYSKLNSAEYKEYFVRRKGVFPMRLVPFDGSKRIADNLMEAIEPYDYGELADFNDSYLNGVYAERYDQSPSDLAPRISNRFRDYMYDMAVDMTKSMNYTICNLKNNYSKSSNHKCYYALLPVWFITYEYKGATYKIVVNGQTGKVSGKVPMIKDGFVGFQLSQTPIRDIVMGMMILTYFEGLFLLFLLMATKNIILMIVLGIIALLCNIIVTTLLVIEKKKIQKLSGEKGKDTTSDNGEATSDKRVDTLEYIDKSGISGVERIDDYLGMTQFAENGKGRNAVNIFDLE